jgi:hypothetical protein
MSRARLAAALTYAQRVSYEAAGCYTNFAVAG